MLRNFRPVLAGGLVALAVATPASAADVTLMLDAPEAEALSVNYRCEGVSAPMTVEYINAGDDSLAMVPVEGGRRVMVSVLAASGARYAGGAFVWWTKGREGSLIRPQEGRGRRPGRHLRRGRVAGRATGSAACRDGSGRPVPAFAAAPPPCPPPRGGRVRAEAVGTVQSQI